MEPQIIVLDEKSHEGKPILEFKGRRFYFFSTDGQKTPDLRHVFQSENGERLVYMVMDAQFQHRQPEKVLGEYPPPDAWKEKMPLCQTVRQLCD